MPRRFQLWARRRRFENYYDGMKFRALGEARWILGVLAVCWLASLAWLPAVSLAFAALLLFSLYFFRDPERQPPPDEMLAVAPADGLVVEVKEAGESQFINQRVKRVAIFLSVFDVHVNRAPIAGEITHSEPMTGRFLDARNPASAQVNARRTWAIRGRGVTIVVRQITGAIARRICAWKQVGDAVERGERFGMIRFGSRTEVDLPFESEILVKPGEKVRGGETPIARLSAKQA
jgi:phosphatidylserine decarboxylase